jgi:hypothetical protein
MLQMLSWSMVMKKIQIIAALFVAAFASVGTASAQDAYGAGGYGPSGFEGIYGGGYGGGLFSSNSKWTGGVVAGANFEVTESILVGAEAQGGISSDGTTTTGDALMLAKAGALVSPETMAYVAAGGGMASGKWTYAIGGGVEYMPVENIGIRGEILGLTNTVDGWTDTKATAGVIWHVK